MNGIFVTLFVYIWHVTIHLARVHKMMTWRQMGMYTVLVIEHVSTAFTSSSYYGLFRDHLCTYQVGCSGGNSPCWCQITKLATVVWIAHVDPRFHIATIVWNLASKRTIFSCDSDGRDDEGKWFLGSPFISYNVGILHVQSTFHSSIAVIDEAWARAMHPLPPPPTHLQVSILISLCIMNVLHVMKKLGKGESSHSAPPPKIITQRRRRGRVTLHLADKIYRHTG